MKKLLLTLACALTVAGAAQAGVYRGEINGEFTGWQGNSVYELMDGHIIKQAEYTYDYTYSYNPEIMIYEEHGVLKCHLVDENIDDVAIEVVR
jgi:hypothetical protein